MSFNPIVPVNIDEQASEAVKRVAELESAFLEIQMPRTEYAIKHFVVGQHDTSEQQYLQCVLEMQIKYDNIRRAQLNKKKVLLKIANLEKENTEESLIDAELAKIDLQEQDRALLGALREFKVLYDIYEASPKYTREQIDQGQPEYWRRRLTRQAEQEQGATGRIGAGNLEAIRQMTQPVALLTAENATPKAIEDHVKSVQEKYLSVGDTKVLIVVATREKAEELAVLEKLEVPSGVQVKYLNVYGQSTADAYNSAAKTLLDDKADFLLCIEDDTYPPEDGFVKIINLLRKHEGQKVVLGGWYPKKTASKEGTPIVVINGRRQALAADGNVHEVFTIPQGFTLIPATVFTETNFPWFVTTPNLTQDSFFSQLARDAGYKLLVDTSIRCRHLDVKTGVFYE
jgi:hypothetical protein